MVGLVLINEADIYSDGRLKKGSDGLPLEIENLEVSCKNSKLTDFSNKNT